MQYMRTCRLYVVLALCGERVGVPEGNVENLNCIDCEYCGPLQDAQL